MAHNQNAIREDHYSNRQRLSSNGTKNEKTESAQKLSGDTEKSNEASAVSPVPKAKSARGFASMDPERQREIARKGGRSVPPEKRSFSQDPKLAAEAGRKGGENVPPEKRSFSQDRALAAEAGRKGGEASGSKRSETNQ